MADARRRTSATQPRRGAVVLAVVDRQLARDRGDRTPPAAHRLDAGARQRASEVGQRIAAGREVVGDQHDPRPVRRPAPPGPVGQRQPASSSTPSSASSARKRPGHGARDGAVAGSGRERGGASAALASQQPGARGARSAGSGSKSS